MSQGKFIDLTGMEFADGNIKVIKRAPDHITPSGYKRIVWECKCSCGNTFISNSHSITHGVVKSCGCKSATAFIDLTGMIFDRLKVIKRVEDYIQPNGRTVARWLCLCECGNEITVNGKNLRDKRTKSCGCSRKGINKKYNKYDLTGEYGVGYTSKGEEFLFDLEDYDKIKDYCWHLSHGYVASYIPLSNHKNVLFHKLVMNYSDEMDIDHINHKKHDNRKKNLRIVTRTQNNMNKNTYRRNTSCILEFHIIKD